ncbi:ABC transporter ATP-binding protein [Aureimonas sp. AU12]|uniref:ABC transporter ATP-binding protein n=1 Tax=Aureimonas sp. AU12 TaxID=1638161 RepID=UPI0007822598|nr:ABC transporter ATP-binding protein [Aureimonas sp. AU12]
MTQQLSERREAGSRTRATTAPVSFAAELEFRNIGFRAGSRRILDDVSIRAQAGKVLCLLGPSGSGKTSLLRIAAGIERQTEGSLWLGGSEVAGGDRFVPPERRGIGLMFQDFALFPHMTLLDNVRFGLRDLGASESRAAAMAALDRVGLVHAAADYPHTLSGGEQQRVALARALTPRPQVLLMDEPFSGLDSRLKDMVRTDTLQILRETKSTAVVVTHDAEEAMRMGDRIALLRDGKLVQVGTAHELYRHPASLFAAAFFSEINVLQGVVRGGRVESPLGAVAASPRSDGTSMTIGLRLNGLRVTTKRDGIEARILSRRFLGSVDLLTLAVAGADSPLRARIRPGDLEADVHEVFVSVDPQEIFVFEDTSGLV